MLDEEGGDNHAHPVVHGAGVPKLAHSRIDDGIAGLAKLPGPQRLFIATPRERIEGGLEIAGREIGDVVKEMTAELAPAEFAQEFLDVAGKRRIVVGGEARGMPDLSRTDFAEPQMR